MSENSELEDLDQLVNCPGWARFAEMVDKQWGFSGTRYNEAVKAAARIGAADDAMQQLRQIIAAQREVQSVLAMPDQRIKYLKGAAVNAAAALVGSSRRGTL